MILEDLGVAIHGQSFAKAAVTDNLALAYPKPVSGHFNIGLLHTGMGGVDGHERYAPCTLDDLRARGYDYWALGHVHTRQVICQDPFIAFPGNAQGRHIRETGHKGCLVATVQSNQRVETAFERLDRVRWERVYVDTTEAESESELLEYAAKTLDDALAAESEPETILAIRLEFTGNTSLHSRIQADADRLVAELRSIATERGSDQIWLEKVELATCPLRSAVVLEGPFHELVDVIEQFRTEPAFLNPVINELAELKRKLPAELTHDVDGPHLDDGPWIQTLLEQVQPLLLDLLTHSESTDAK